MIACENSGRSVNECFPKVRKTSNIPKGGTKSIREEIGLNRKDFALKYGIPLRTIEDWEHGKRKMPSYLLCLLAYKVKYDKLIIDEQDSSNNIKVICDAEGKKVVLINDIRFKSRRAINWEKIEEYLKEYIGRCFVILRRKCNGK